MLVFLHVLDFEEVNTMCLLRLLPSLNLLGIFNDVATDGIGLISGSQWYLLDGMLGHGSDPKQIY